MGLTRHLALLATLLLASCAEQEQTDTQTSIAPDVRTVVITDPHLACLVEPLLAEDVALVTVAPDDPTDHDTGWSPEREDARALRNADLVVTPGGGSDFWLDIIGLREDRVLRLANAYPDALIPIATDTHSHGPGGEHSHTIYAPRPWHEPGLAERATVSIESRLRSDGLLGSTDDHPSRTELALIDLALPDNANTTLVVTTRDAWRHGARRVGARALTVEPDADPVWVRVEVSASNAQRVILVGDIDAEGVRATMEDAAIEILEIPLSDDPCGWVDALRAFADALTDPR